MENNISDIEDFRFKKSIIEIVKCLGIDFFVEILCDIEIKKIPYSETPEGRRRRLYTIKGDKD